MQDPTRDELIEFLRGQYPVVTCGESADGDGAEFDIEEAAYYIAAHYHGGQWSNLYSALSVSEFRPGAATKDLPDDDERSTASDLYRAAGEWIEDAS